MNSRGFWAKRLGVRDIFKAIMEHGSYQDQSKATFSLTDEDHTLANSVRFVLNQDPRVAVCGYSIPHPSDARVNIRVQTTGDPAGEVLKDACQDLMLMCQHIRSTFEPAAQEFRRKQEKWKKKKGGKQKSQIKEGMEAMDINE